MQKLLSLLLIPFLLFSEELEVRLATHAPLKALYLSKIRSDDADWRYTDDLRSILEFDLNAGGFCTVLSTSDALEESLDSLKTWKNAGVFYLLTAQLSHNTLNLTAFDIERKTSKKYPALLLSGKLDRDRHLLHQLADKLHKDLFGVEGIASLKILYAQRTSPASERISEIWASDLDGTNAEQLTFENGYCVSPSFFPNAHEFFYVSFKDGQSKIYRSSLSDKKATLMVSLRGNQILPSISPQGTHLAFITDIAGRPDLFLQPLDPTGAPQGKARQLFSAPRATQASPTFSPKGDQIAFVSDKDGPPRIYLLEANTRKMEKLRPRLLTKRNRENTSPAWSPDGTKLAYSAKSDDARQIWIYDFATEEEIQLTTGPEMKENPTWAPDSLHLIYNTESEESCELYLLNIRNPNPVRISKGPGQKRFPCWQGMNLYKR